MLIFEKFSKIFTICFLRGIFPIFRPRGLIGWPLPARPSLGHLLFWWSSSRPIGALMVGLVTSGEPTSTHPTAHRPFDPKARYMRWQPQSQQTTKLWLINKYTILDSILLVKHFWIAIKINSMGFFGNFSLKRSHNFLLWFKTFPLIKLKRMLFYIKKAKNPKI